MNSFNTRSLSASLFSCACSSVITLSSQPVSWLASRTFCPPRPIAWESCSSCTATSIDRESSSTTMETTSAGDMALITYLAGSSSHRMMSTRSPASSLDTACTRDPRMPTQAPTGSMRGTRERTPILAREPGSRAQPMISMSPSPISGTSRVNSWIMSSGAVRLTNSCGPRVSERTSRR